MGNYSIEELEEIYKKEVEQLNSIEEETKKIRSKEKKKKELIDMIKKNRAKLEKCKEEIRLEKERNETGAKKTAKKIGKGIVDYLYQLKGE